MTKSSNLYFFINFPNSFELNFGIKIIRFDNGFVLNIEASFSLNIKKSVFLHALFFDFERKKIVQKYFASSRIFNA